MLPTPHACCHPQLLEICAILTDGLDNVLTEAVDLDVEDVLECVERVEEGVVEEEGPVVRLEDGGGKGERWTV